MEQGAVKRSGPGRPRLRPLRLVRDKGYTGRRIRNYLRRRGIRLTIPRLSLRSTSRSLKPLKSTVNATLPNALSTDSNNFDVLLLGMKSWL